MQAIVIGSGPLGAIASRRLVENGLRVSLVEAGQASGGGATNGRMADARAGDSLHRDGGHPLASAAGLNQAHHRHDLSAFC